MKLRKFWRRAVGDRDSRAQSANPDNEEDGSGTLEPSWTPAPRQPKNPRRPKKLRLPMRIVGRPTAEGYDEAVERGVPFSAEQNVRAEYSADPVALTEADPMTVDELGLQDAGRDLRPDVITRPQILFTAVSELEAAGLEEDDAASPRARQRSPMKQVPLSNRHPTKRPLRTRA